MIDLHCHILPGIDDGARDLNESLEMARAYVAAGYTEVAATPHYLPGSATAPEAALIRELVQELNHALRHEGIALRLWPGAEVGLDADIPALIDDGGLQYLGGSNFLLIEPPFQRLPNGWEKIIDAILARGVRLLLAHPERCAQLMRTPEIMDDLICAGVFLQMNWGSLIGVHGQEAEALAWIMLMRGSAHCLATDSHDARFRNAGLVAHAAKVVEKRIGRRALDQLACSNPARILKDQPPASIDVADVRKEPAKKRFWQVWK